jgi:hypothetical protein
VVNGQRLKHYLAGENFVKKVEVVYFQTPEKVIFLKSRLPEP